MKLVELWYQIAPLPKSRPVVFPDGRIGDIVVDDQGESVEISTLYPSEFQSLKKVIPVRTKAEKGSRIYNRLKIPGANEAVRAEVKKLRREIQQIPTQIRHEGGLGRGTMIPGRRPHDSTGPRSRGHS